MYSAGGTLPTMDRPGYPFVYVLTIRTGGQTAVEVVQAEEEGL